MKTLRDDNGHIKGFYTKEKNPCGCGGNCFSYALIEEESNKSIVAVCSFCKRGIYEVKPEYFDEYIAMGEWKEAEREKS